MNEPARPLGVVEAGTAEPDAAAKPAQPAAAFEDRERSFDEVPCWPVTRLAAWSLTLLLGVSILLPALAGGASGADWLVLLAPVIVATLCARALFEALRFVAGSRGAIANLAGVLAPALLAAAVMAAASPIDGLRRSLVVGGTTALLSAATLAAAGAVRSVEIRVRLSLRRVYFIGCREAERDLARELDRRHDARLVASSRLGGAADCTDRDVLAAAVLASRATVLVLDNYAMRVPELVEMASRLSLAGLHVCDLVSYYEHEFKKVPLAELSPTWFLFDVASFHRRVLYGSMRRALDIVVACVLLLLVLPVLIVAGTLVGLTSPGPVLYRQRRVGRNGSEFSMVKLRTMTQSTQPDPAPVWASSDADRITPIGSFLRRFRLDELPQLWNVVRGDLALVGPRPEQVAIAARLSLEIPYYDARHSIRPGLTGWAQVNLGYGGSTGGTIAKLQRDLYYIKHITPRLDVLIVWLTLKAVLAGRG